MGSGRDAMGTAAQAARDTRARVWAELRGVARPVSLFHWEFASFIPDFAGSEACTDRITALPAWAGLKDRRVFVTPDNSTEDFRRRLLLLRQPFVITTYGIVRGFLAVDPADVPPGEERYAATLDGADRYGRPLSLPSSRPTAASACSSRAARAAAARVSASARGTATSTSSGRCCPSSAWSAAAPRSWPWSTTAKW